MLGNYGPSSLIDFDWRLRFRFVTFDMADDEVATKAPESDAKEPSMMSSEDTPAQKGASMGVRYVALLS